MHAKLDIYNIKGQCVKCLENNVLDAGLHSYSWNGTDNTGNKCSSGIYFSRLDTKKGSVTNKMVLLK